MRAVIIPSFGSPDVLRIEERPDPQPGEREVLVRVRASALNRADILQREGRYPPPPDAPKDIPGIEFAGEVERVGVGVTRWKRGDRVFAITGGGGHAELVVAHEGTLVAIPQNLNWTEAGAIPEACITAHDALVTQAALRAGERVLIHAVGSGVGLAASQIARGLGAIPYGTSRTKDKIERAREFGLEDGVVVHDALGVIGETVALWSNGEGMAVVLDLVGGPYVSASIEALALKGRLMLIGAMGGSHVEIDLRKILAKRLTLRGTVLRARALDEKIAAAHAFARDVVPMLLRRTVRPVIDSVFPLERIVEAHVRMESNATFGKVVLTV